MKVFHLLLTISISVFCFSVTLIAEDFLDFSTPEKKEDPFLNAFLSQEIGQLQESIEKSFIGEKKLQSSFLYKKEKKENTLSKTVWDGNDVEIDMNITGTTLEFQHAGQDKRFFVNLGFEKDALVVRHSSPRDKKMLGGVKFPWNRKGVYQGYISTKNPTGLTVFMGPEKSDSKFRPVMLCFAKPVRKIKSRAQVFYEGYPTALKRVRYDAEGEISASMLSGHGRGSLFAEFVSSKGLAMSFPAFDDVEARDPKIDLRYKKQEQDLALAEVRSDSNLVRGGLLGKLRFKNAAGYIREINEAHILNIAKTKMPSNHPFRKSGGSLFFSKAPCWLIFESRGNITQFSKSTGAQKDIGKNP